MLYHDLSNDYRQREVRVAIRLQEGYYFGEIYGQWIASGAMGHGLSLSIVEHMYNDLLNLEYDTWSSEEDKTGGFEHHNNCGFIIDMDNIHVHFVLHDHEGNRLEKTIEKWSLGLYIVGAYMVKCVGKGVKKDVRKCVMCKNFERIESTGSGNCLKKDKKVSQGTTICKYGFIPINK